MGSGTARNGTNWGHWHEDFEEDRRLARPLLEWRQGFGAGPPRAARGVGPQPERVDHDRDRDLRAHQHARRSSRTACSPAQELGLPLVEVSIPLGCPNETYDARMHEVFASERLGQVTQVAFGDLFLEDVRAYREGRLGAAGKRGLFPL